LKWRLQPEGGPIRQKSAFLPEHPDNRRISPHIEIKGAQKREPAMPVAMRDASEEMLPAA
jgi:hypothetical protein